MEGPPGSMAAAGSMVGARGVALGVTESSPCGPAVTWSPEDSDDVTGDELKEFPIGGPTVQ